jgi:hypothetical protein
VHRAADSPHDRAATSPPLSPADAPKPTARFRRRAWLEFQRALDPLARRTEALATLTTGGRER